MAVGGWAAAPGAARPGAQHLQGWRPHHCGGLPTAGAGCSLIRCSWCYCTPVSWTLRQFQLTSAGYRSLLSDELLRCDCRWLLLAGGAGRGHGRQRRRRVSGRACQRQRGPDQRQQGLLGGLICCGLCRVMSKGCAVSRLMEVHASLCGKVCFTNRSADIGRGVRTAGTNKYRLWAEWMIIFHAALQ